MATKATVKQLKTGAERLGIEIPEDVKKKSEIEALIDEHLSTMELGYECPSCGKDIPDLPYCPYCNESFDEDEEAEEVIDEEAEEVIDEEIEEAEIEESDEAVEVEEVEDINSDAEIDEVAQEVAEAVQDSEPLIEKSEEKPNDNKSKSDKRGRPVGKTKNTEEKENEFTDLISAIDHIVGDGFEKRERKTGITYVMNKKRLLKAVSTGKTLSIEFNVEIDSDIEGLKKYTAEEAKAKHLGSTRAIYSIGDMEAAINLVKKAFTKFSS